MEKYYDLKNLNPNAVYEFATAVNNHQRLSACYYSIESTLLGTSENDFRKLMSDAKTAWKLNGDELTLVAKAVIESILHLDYPRVSVDHLLDVYYDARQKDANGIKEMEIDGVMNVPPSLTKDVLSEFFIREVK